MTLSAIYVDTVKSSDSPCVFTTMPLPHLVSPSPDARMPNSFEDREAQARLKLHLLMARLRTGFRTLMDRGPPGVIPNWKVNLRDETVSHFSSSSGEL